MFCQLDAIGLMCSIDRVSKKKYTFLVNGEAIKSYKKRHSANRQLIKIYKQNKTKIYELHKTRFYR
jgi:hypothetical protein